LAYRKHGDVEHLCYNRVVGEITRKTGVEMKIALTSVSVDSPDKAFRFYTQVLGFAERMYVPEANLAIVASPEEPGGTGLLLEPSDNPIGKTHREALYQAGLPAIVFGVQDLQKEYERLKGLGVVFRQAPTKTDWGMQAVFNDTCGNFIQLHQV
jgi:predicted enzyme related to lactoylglutathione lyase